MIAREVSTVWKGDAWGNCEWCEKKRRGELEVRMVRRAARAKRKTKPAKPLKSSLKAKSIETALPRKTTSTKVRTEGVKPKTLRVKPFKNGRKRAMANEQVKHRGTEATGCNAYGCEGPGA